jgi:tyrosyl-tRNA synthetase
MIILSDLKERGLLHQVTDIEGLGPHLATGSRSVYAGFDPTRDSLTVGNLVQILLLRRFQLAGHRPVVLLGGGTGLIGDPSGKEAERQIQELSVIEGNVRSQRKIFDRLLDTAGPNGVHFVNNADWLCRLSFIEVLRDVGKHFSVNMMIQKDSVRERLQNREQGISYTEFSYMLLQAYDFWHLHREANVTLQAAGSDQWGNIVAGIDLIRRNGGKDAFGLTTPLVTKADGGKFGKTESGAVWLTADRTSPYEFYQFWLNASDADVARFLPIYTLIPLPEIRQLLEEHAADPGKRAAQRALAAHVTELVHGPEGRARAEAATKALFSGDVSSLGEEALTEVFGSAPSATLHREKLLGDGSAIVDLLVEGAVAKSKREARELLEQGAVLVNGTVAKPDAKFQAESLMFGQVLLVRRGKKIWHVLRFS